MPDLIQVYIFVVTVGTFVYVKSGQSGICNFT